MSISRSSRVTVILPPALQGEGLRWAAASPWEVSVVPVLIAEPFPGLGMVDIRSWSGLASPQATPDTPALGFALILCDAPFQFAEGPAPAPGAKVGPDQPGWQQNRKGKTRMGVSGAHPDREVWRASSNLEQGLRLTSLPSAGPCRREGAENEGKGRGHPPHPSQA